MRIRVHESCVPCRPWVVTEGARPYSPSAVATPLAKWAVSGMRAMPTSVNWGGYRTPYAAQAPAPAPAVRPTGHGAPTGLEDPAGHACPTLQLELQGTVAPVASENLPG